MAHLLQQAEPSQWIIRKRQERFADVISGKLFAFKDQDPMASFCQQGGRCATRRSATNNGDIEFVPINGRSIAVYPLAHICVCAGGRISTISASDARSAFQSVFLRP